MARRRSALVAFVSLAAAIALAGCGGSGATRASASFLLRSPSRAVFVRWTRRGDALAGIFDETVQTRPPGSGIEPISIGFTGTISGADVTLALRRPLSSARTLAGRLTAAGLRLGDTGALVPGSELEYDHAVDNVALSQYRTPCTLYVEGQDTTLTLRGPRAFYACASFVDSAPRDPGAPWTTELQRRSSPRVLVCAVSLAPNVAAVRDRPGGRYGRQACAVLRGEGWVPRR
jgi:hypothetical protein